MTYTVTIQDDATEYSSEFEPFNADPLEWAKKYCPSYITNVGYIDHNEIYYTYTFSNASDATIFALRWS